MDSFELMLKPPRRDMLIASRALFVLKKISSGLEVDRAQKN